MHLSEPSPLPLSSSEEILKRRHTRPTSPSQPTSSPFQPPTLPPLSLSVRVIFLLLVSFLHLIRNVTRRSFRSYNRAFRNMMKLDS